MAGAPSGGPWKMQENLEVDSGTQPSSGLTLITWAEPQAGGGAEKGQATSCTEQDCAHWGCLPSTSSFLDCFMRKIFSRGSSRQGTIFLSTHLMIFPFSILLCPSPSQPGFLGRMQPFVLRHPLDGISLCASRSYVPSLGSVCILFFKPFSVGLLSWRLSLEGSLLLLRIWFNSPSLGGMRGS